MNILSWLLFGVIVGIVSNSLEPHPSRNSPINAILLGVLGAFIGGILANVLFGITITGFSLMAFVVAVLGSLGVLFFGRRVQRI